MANIPLVQVPNAPQTGNTAVLADPSSIRTPNLMRGASMIAQGANMLQMEQLPMEAFDAGGMGKGLEALGDSGARASAAFGDFAVRLGRAHDEAQMVELENYQADLLSRFDAEVATKPPDQWGSIYNEKYEPQLVDFASTLRMSSPLSSSKRDNAVKSLRLRTAAEIRTKSTKATVENYRQSMQNYIERSRNEGRLDDAMAGYKRGAAAGLWSDEVAEEGMIQIEEEQKVNTMTQAIQQNPAQWRKELARYQEEGKNPHKLRPEQVLQFRRMAEGTHAQLLDDLNNEMLNRLETESAAITNEQIETFYTRPDIDAPRELINKMKEYRGFKYADTPEGKAEKATNYSDLWQAIFSYDAATDISMADPDTHKREYQQLQQRIIESAPEGERKPFLDTLNDMVSQATQGRKSRADDVARGLIDITGKLATWGQLGGVVEYRKEKRGDVEVTVPKDPQTQLAVETKRLEITNDIRRMMRENPDLTEEQAMERFKGILENRLDGGALFMQQPDEDSWWDTLRDVATWADFAMNPTANNPNVMAAGFNFPSGKAPASIRHNNAGAMWYRANSWQSKFGATFGQKLNDGLGQGNQIASFPTPVHGAAALLYQLNRPSYVSKTVREAISKWSGGNSVSSYLSVLRGAGFSADQRVSDIMADPQSAVAFAKAMARHEAGTEYPMSDDQWQQAYNMFRQA